MKPSPQFQQKLGHAWELICRLPLDSAQRTSVAETLAARDDAVVDRFIKETSESLAELAQLNVRVNALLSGVPVEVKSSHLPGWAVSGYTAAAAEHYASAALLLRPASLTSRA